MPASAAGLCSGASGASLRISAMTSSSMMTPAEKRVPPWTTRWPMAAMPVTSFSSAPSSLSWSVFIVDDQLVMPFAMIALFPESSTTHLRVLEPALRISTRLTAQSLSTCVLRRDTWGTLPNRADDAHAVDERPTHTAADEDCGDTGSGIKYARQDQATDQGWRQRLSPEFLTRRSRNAWACL